MLSGTRVYRLLLYFIGANGRHLLLRRPLLMGISKIDFEARFCFHDFDGKNPLSNGGVISNVIALLSFPSISRVTSQRIAVFIYTSNFKKTF